ncbi:glycosyltransferase family 4 protein [Candidatus Omnitrophota bacterium]
MIKTLYISYMGLTEPLLYSQVLNYLKILSQKGVLVHILSFEKEQFLTETNMRQIKKDLDMSGIKWSFLRYHKRFQLFSKPYDIIRGLIYVFYISLKEGIDVIHARTTLCALIGILPRLLLRKKMVFDIRGFMAEEYVDAGLWKRGSLFHKLVNRLEGYFAERSDEVVILTNKAKDFVVNRYNMKSITVIPACVDLNRFNLERTVNDGLRSRYLLDGKFVLMYTGSIGTWYMLSEMVDFYRELANSNLDTAFFILSQTEKRFIERCIPEDLKKKVIIDSTGPTKVVDFLNLSDAGIFFIKPCLSKISSCPTKFAEYLATGLPVVINRGVGDTEAIVRENKVGVVIEDFTPAEYRRNIQELKGLLKEGQALRERCYKTAQRYFSLADGGEKYTAIYERLGRIR